VLGAFHTKLRQTDDQTERYVAAVRNPTVTVLAHPTTRKWGRRLGLPADWPAVFEAAFEAGTAVEIDGSPDRQDLPVPLVQAAVESGVTFSLGSDAHAPEELAFIDYAMAAAIIAAVPVERILNHRSADDVAAWAAKDR
jgi:histidinol phosphatase-like PHP family hydrolase